MIGMRMTVKTEHQLQDGGPLNTYADRLDVRLLYLSSLPRTCAPNYGLLDVTGNVHRT